MPADALPTPPGSPATGGVRVRMLVPLGGHQKYDLVDVPADEVAAYVAAGYVEMVAP